MKKLLFLCMIFLVMVSFTTHAQEMLTGGNMESATDWNISLLNTEAGAEPTATWNYTTDAPTAGIGGNLHVTGTTTSGNSQYCIYQEVTLSNTKSYKFDGAYKAIQINNSWCEVFIGPKPVDSEDYGTDVPRLAAFGTWAGYTSDDGIFSVDIDSVNYNVFVPDTNGIYYLVIKMGSNSWDGSSQTFEMIVDELSLIEDGAPIASFSNNITTGLAPVDVQFTDESNFATAWEWDFGDGSAVSNDQNPLHTYSTTGTYTVTLTVTNAEGSDQIVKTDLIEVSPATTLTAGGVIDGGEMSDVSKWNISFLNTAAENNPTVAWNDMTNTPSAGQGGALYVEGSAPSGQNVQYCIYQQVSLHADSIYSFNGAFRDFSADLNNAWSEVFIGPEPIDGMDYSKNDAANFLLSEFTTWSSECNPKGVDGTFEGKSCGINGFIPDSTGDYFFVLKLGSWEGGDFKMAIDELSLTASRVEPIAAFSADNPLGFVPLTVQFTDESSFGESWEWNFGDGSAVSTDQNPTHEYTTPGTYTVTLNVTNEIGTTELIKTDYIKVNEKPALPEGEMLYGGNMENPNLWNITQLNANATTTATWNNTSDIPTAGEGGNLLLEATVTDQTANYAIWQAVELTEGQMYAFTAAFMDITPNVDHFWSEVIIGTSAPVDDADYSKDDHTMIAFFNTWDCGTAPGLDGTYQDNGCSSTDPVGTFVPNSTATYYFVIKTGINDWESSEYNMSVIIDEVSFKETEVVEADFFADITVGDSPLTVYFTDLSINATEWHWDFGDGTTSTDQHPQHTYDQGGTYSVQLVALNGDITDTTQIADLITVNSTVDVSNNLSGEKIFNVYPNPSNGTFNISNLMHESGSIVIYDIIGNVVKSLDINEGVEQKTINMDKSGVFIIEISSKSKIQTERLIIH